MNNIPSPNTSDEELDAALGKLTSYKRERQFDDVLRKRIPLLIGLRQEGVGFRRIADVFASHRDPAPSAETIRRFCLEHGIGDTPVENDRTPSSEARQLELGEELT